MGDIAEGILNGDFCQETGEYLGEGMGFPRTRMDRNVGFYKMNPKNGIRKYLKQWYSKCEHFDICMQFLDSINTGIKKEEGWDIVAMAVSLQWDDFVQFVRKK